MKINPEILTALRDEGYATLQAPEYSIGRDSNGDVGVISDINSDEPTSIEVPDDWFMRIKSERLAVGKEKGFLFISPKGYEANKADLLEAFEMGVATTGRNDDMSRDDFDRYAQDFFAKVKAKTEKFIAKGNTHKKIAEATEKLAKLF